MCCIHHISLWKGSSFFKQFESFGIASPIHPDLLNDFSSLNLQPKNSEMSEMTREWNIWKHLHVLYSFCQLSLRYRVFPLVMYPTGNLFEPIMEKWTFVHCTVPPVVVLIDLMFKIWFILYKSLNKPIVEYTHIEYITVQKFIQSYLP